MRFQLVLREAIALVLALVSACAHHRPLIPDGASSQVRDCLYAYARLNEAIDRMDARDAQEHRLAGFPYLRVNRFVASFRDAARTDPVARDALFKGMAALDLHARQFEIANLPPEVRTALGALQLDTCSAALVQFDRSTPERATAILDLAQVPDAYAEWKRALGLYTLTSVPFRWGVRQWEDSTRRTFASSPEVSLQRWTPPPADAALITRHAPVFEIDARTPDDHFGAPHWMANSVRIDTQTPVVFTHVTHTRFEGQTLPQLVYTLWFPSRPRDGPFDLLAGHLDALTVRLTLDHDGEILIADSIHACGCYHLFFPSSRLRERPPPNADEEWAFSPASLPTIKAGQRLAFRVASGTHYLSGIGAAAFDATVQTRYALQPADGLRSMPLPEGAGRRSLYGADGFVAGTERGERFLFWPMGIASPGAMRQWGHHATAFVGRRHFDDVDLVEKRFARVDAPGKTKVQ
jgi:hypothetical protein